MDRCGSGGLSIHHLDRPDIYFPDAYVRLKNCSKNSSYLRNLIIVLVFWLTDCFLYTKICNIRYFLYVILTIILNFYKGTNNIIKAYISADKYFLIWFFICWYLFSKNLFKKFLYTAEAKNQNNANYKYLKKKKKRGIKFSIFIIQI